jgi:urea carboxylase-associated protein 2
MPTRPASNYRPVPVGIDPGALVWAERVAGGGYAHQVVAAGTTIRLTDLDGDACAHLLLFRAGEPWERLNVADTVKVQWQAYLGKGSLLLSDQGRVLASIMSDTSGHHDALCGGSSRSRNEARYGSGSPEGPSPAARELFLLAAAKHGLGARDLPPCCSLFKGVRVEPDSGALEWTGSCGSAASVELRTELPLLVLVANTAHPVDTRPTWSCGTLELLAWSGAPTAVDAWPATRSPEAERAFRNNLADSSARQRVPA